MIDNIRIIAEVKRIPYAVLDKDMDEAQFMQILDGLTEDEVGMLKSILVREFRNNVHKRITVKEARRIKTIVPPEPVQETVLPPEPVPEEVQPEPPEEQTAKRAYRRLTYEVENSIRTYVLKQEEFTLPSLRKAMPGVTRYIAETWSTGWWPRAYAEH